MTRIMLVEAGVAQRHRFLGGRHGHSVRARRHHRPGHRQGAVAVAVGLDGDEHAGAGAEEGGQMSDVATDRGQIYEDAAAR